MGLVSGCVGVPVAVWWGLDMGTLFSSESEAQLARYFISLFHLFFNSVVRLGLGGTVEGMALRSGDLVGGLRFFFSGMVHTRPGLRVLFAMIS
jgi:hypothetical protein